MPTIRALIFDLDGVITDTAEFHYLSWKQLADEEGLPFTRADNEALRGVSRRESLRRLLKGRPIDEDTAAAWMKRKNDYFLELLDRVTPADRLPGVTSLLEDARRTGLRLGIGSASKNVRPVLDKLGLSDAFDAIGDAHSEVVSKPAPDLFVWIAGRLDVYPTQTVIFEDAEAGIEAGRRGRFWTVGIGPATDGLAHLHYDSMAAITLADVLTKLAALG
ncbi:MAG: beta-phosphoglucomutase [Anaerolineae bacterium]|nr:beta-phosphoglucomutase [Anaerolineae bacterium]